MNTNELNKKIEEYCCNAKQKYSSQEQKEILQKLDMAQQGDSDAMLYTGIKCCRECVGDKDLGYYWIEKAAYEKDVPDAYSWLAACFFWGWGVQQDFDKVFELIDQAVLKGSKIWTLHIYTFLEKINTEKIIPFYVHAYSIEDEDIKYKTAERLCIIYCGTYYPQLRNREQYYYWLNEMRKIDPDSPDFFDEPEFIDWAGEALMIITEYMLAGDVIKRE